jgi:hypothetical protein
MKKTEQKTWQSEFAKIQAEAKEWDDQRQAKWEKYLEQKERHDKIVKKIEKWVFMPFFSYIGAPVILMFTLLVHLFYTGIVFHWSFLLLLADHHMLQGLHDGIVLFAAFHAGLCIALATKWFEIKSKLALFALPCGYVLVWLGCTGGVYLAASGFFDLAISVVASWVLLLFGWFCAYLYVDGVETEQKYDFFYSQLGAKLEAIKDLPHDNTEVKESPEGKCSICEKESQYETCLSCEKQFRNERHRVRAQILRAKQHHAPATLTLHEWLEILTNFHWRCAYCHGPYELMEHYIPLPHGGTTADNVVPACFSCNSKKSNRHPER